MVTLLFKMATQVASQSTEASNRVENNTPSASYANAVLNFKNIDNKENIQAMSSTQTKEHTPKEQVQKNKKTKQPNNSNPSNKASEVFPQIKHSRNHRRVSEKNESSKNVKTNEPKQKNCASEENKEMNTKVSNSEPTDEEEVQIVAEKEEKFVAAPLPTTNPWFKKNHEKEGEKTTTQENPNQACSSAGNQEKRVLQPPQQARAGKSPVDNNNSHSFFNRIKKKHPFIVSWSIFTFYNL